MEILTPGFDLDRFFAHVADAGQRALLLDYDGTLAPFQNERMKAVPYAGVREILERLVKARHTRVVLISGRMIKEVTELAGLAEAVEVWGSHGWERLHAGGAYEVAPLEEAAARALQEAEAVVSSGGLSAQYERKPASVAFHTRTLTAPEEQEKSRAIRQRWQEIAEPAALSVEAFDGGFELRVPGRDKGVAVNTILSELDAGAAVAYLGDDLTDEDAFRVLRADPSPPGKAGILVRKAFRPTAANLWLRPPEEMLAFLERWLHAANGS